MQNGGFSPISRPSEVALKVINCASLWNHRSILRSDDQGVPIQGDGSSEKVLVLHVAGMQDGSFALTARTAQVAFKDISRTG